MTRTVPRRLGSADRGGQAGGGAHRAPGAEASESEPDVPQDAHDTISNWVVRAGRIGTGRRQPLPGGGVLKTYWKVRSSAVSVGSVSVMVIRTIVGQGQGRVWSCWAFWGT